MLFDYDIIVPAATPRTDPAVQVCHLTSGRLQEIRVKFPPGPATLVHIVIMSSLHQLMPVNPGGSINIDDETILSSNLDYKLSSPYDVIIVGWSPSAVYDHTITVQFDVHPNKQDAFDNFANDLFEAVKHKN
jgi:hypothetical protein